MREAAWWIRPKPGRSCWRPRSAASSWRISLKPSISLSGLRRSCRIRLRRLLQVGSAVEDCDWAVGGGSVSDFIGLVKNSGIRRRSRRSASQEAVDFFEQPREIDRLGLVIVAAGVGRLIAVALHGMGGEGNDRYGLSDRVGLQLARCGPAVHAGQA